LAEWAALPAGQDSVYLLREPVSFDFFYRDFISLVGGVDEKKRASEIDW
jgi:hypothetical protein